MNDPNLHKECMTIVVPVYNRPQLVTRCLDSLKSQTYRPLHLILVDNASTDETLANVEKWKEVNTEKYLTMEILSECRKGAAYARQTGLSKVTSDKVMFFDSDDTMRPFCVESIIKAWDDAPEVDIVAWPVAIHTDGSIKITHKIKKPFLESHLVHAILRTQGYAVKTGFIKGSGGWNGEFPNWNDLETGARILLNNPKLKTLDDVYVDVYHQKESITGDCFSDKAGKWEKSLDGIDKSIFMSGCTEANRLHNIITYRRAILAAHYAKEGKTELAKPLYQKAIKEIPKAKRPLIRFAYHWTRLGMRGAFAIVGKFL